ncbi:MAG: hypothetical protein KDD22_01610 [Bdellovibrionales bacterium]|nr:hypothetical protein [Bdellovibrionales bacterium]
MKLLSLIATLAFAASAQATCPDLRGTYACSSEDGATQQLVLDQFEEANITYYVINGETVPADGITYNLEDDEQFKNQSMTFSCSEESQFVIHFQGDMYQDQTLLGAVDSNEFVTKGETGSLDILSEGTYTPVTQGEEPYTWSEKSSCAPVAPEQGQN